MTLTSHKCIKMNETRLMANKILIYRKINGFDFQEILILLVKPPLFVKL